MRLIDAEHLKWNVGGIKCGTLTVAYLDWILEHEEPTVEAIPVSFIEEMKAWAEENDFALYASDLNHLLLTWAERKEE